MNYSNSTRSKEAFTTVEVALILLALSIFGFIGYQIWSNQSDQSELESSQSETTDDWQEYENEEFAFSLQLPSDVEVEGVVEDYTTDEVPADTAGGKAFSFSVHEHIMVVAHTSDYFISKGPVPLWHRVASGYYEEDGRYYDNSKKEVEFTDKVERVDGGIYFEDQEPFDAEGATVYSYAFNTSAGGVVVTTDNPDSLILLKQIVRTVKTN